MLGATKKYPVRTVMFAQDICNITGLSVFSARRLIRKVRKAFGKPAGTLISVSEFCAVTGLDEGDVLPFLR
jgi:hypothetical protein